MLINDSHLSFHLLYEFLLWYTIIIFFNALKTERNINYYIPISFSENYDNNIIDITSQKGAQEFFIDLLDKIEKELKILIIKNSKRNKIQKYM